MARARLVKGQMMVEVVVAFTVMVIAMVAILQLSKRSVRSSGGANRAAVATSLADEGMDWIRNEENVHGWDWLRGKGAVADDGSAVEYCLSTSPPVWGSAGGCGAGDTLGTEYQRYFFISGAAQVMPAPTPAKRVIEINMTVEWQEGSRTQKTDRYYQFVRGD